MLLINLPTVIQLSQHSPSFFITFVQSNSGHLTSSHSSSAGTIDGTTAGTKDGTIDGAALKY